MTPDREESSQSRAIDWAATALAVVPFFSYILVIGFAPEILARPVVSDSLVSIGLAGGIALTVFLVALAGTYTYLRNRK